MEINQNTALPETGEPTVEPAENRLARFTGGRLLRILLGAAAMLVILFGVQNLSGLINPILIAFLMAVALTPVVGYFERRGLSRTLAVAALIGTIIAIFLGLGVLLTMSLSQLQAKIPEYAANLDARSAAIQQQTSALGVDTTTLDTDSLTDEVNQQNAQKAMGELIGYVAGLLASVFWVLLLFVFLLGDILNLPKRISSGLEVDPGVLPRLDQVRSNVNTYFGIRTQVGIFTGAFNTVVCLLLGVDFAILWGLFAFLTNYLPSFGFVLSAIPPIFFAWLEFGIERAILVAILLLGVNTVVDQLISPRLTSRGMSLPVSVVLLSMTFWGWLLGPIGALLAAPLTIIMKLTLDAFPEAHNVTSLITMGDQPQAAGAPKPKFNIPLPSFLRVRRNAVAPADAAPAIPQVELPAGDKEIL